MRFEPVKVGDRRREQPQTFGDGRLMEGRVVYVHPTGRWYTVEFDVVPVIRRRVNYGGKRGAVVESDGPPCKIREAFHAAPLPSIEPREHANVWKRRIYKA